MTRIASDILGPQREAGVLLHISSLPGPFGIGELGASARRFIDQLFDMQVGVWQFLPAGPTGYGNSPYQSLSTFAGNEMLVDMQDLVDLGLLQTREVADLAALPGSHVDYSALIPIKTRLLALAASRFDRKATRSMKSALRRFIKDNDMTWLQDYALYRTLKSEFDERPWPEWPDRFLRRDKRAMRSFAKANAQKIQATKIIQFLFFRQWTSMRDYAHEKGVRLFGDLPIYIAHDSADAWANQDILRLKANGRPDTVAGVPPDYFSEEGQLWGNPLYDWDKLAADGYQWWINRLSAMSSLVDMIRIDHFRGFESYWAVAADVKTARDGAWEPGPGGAIFDAIRKAIGELPIVAEDLGVITPEVEALRDAYELPGMTVLQFAVDDADFKLSDVRENNVCYTGTHDNDTTVGWFRGGADDARSEHDIRAVQASALRLTGGRAKSIHTDLIQAALSTRAMLAIAPLQDFLGLGSEARMNIPGIAADNWQWRVNGAQLSGKFCDNVASLISASNRGQKNNEHKK